MSGSEGRENPSPSGRGAGGCHPAISTTITKKFFEMKLEDLKESGFFIEFKECKPFWNKRLGCYNSNRDDLCVPFVFLVGNVPHRFTAVSIWQVHRDFVYTKYAEAIKTEFAYAIKCVVLTPEKAVEEIEAKGIQFKDKKKAAEDIRWLREHSCLIAR